MINQQELKAILSYDKDTGIFTRLVSLGNTKAGSIAGVYDKSDGYCGLEINSKAYKLHRLAWIYVYGEFPAHGLDHINGIKHDNRISNLRLATDSENQCNIPIKSNNTSGFKGVSFNKRSCKWIARCAVNKISHYLGWYDTAEEASKAYNDFASENHGEFYFNTLETSND